MSFEQKILIGINTKMNEILSRLTSQQDEIVNIQQCVERLSISTEDKFLKIFKDLSILSEGLYVLEHNIEKEITSNVEKAETLQKNRIDEQMKELKKQIELVNDDVRLLLVSSVMNEMP